MVVIELRFPAGRFHATPYGRNVNEGIPEWPPSPYRLARALLDTCFRMAPEMQGQRLEKVLDIIAAKVSYVLPKAAGGHIRYYQNENLFDRLKKQKIFDPFVAINRKDYVLMLFDCEPEREALFDLKHLLGFLNYLGRSESWVSARLAQSTVEEVNCSECSVEDCISTDTACLKPRFEYEAMKNAFQQRGERSLDGMSWVEALCMGTSELKEEGWSQPPAMTLVTMHMPRNLLDSFDTAPEVPFPCGFKTAWYSIDGKVRPLVTDTLIIAERVRRKLMGIHKYVMEGDPSKVSLNFSGKNPDSSPVTGHGHCFYLPLDMDRDGRLDTLIITSNTPFNEDETEALNRLDSVWQEKGRGDLSLVLTRLSKENSGIKGRVWESATPFVTSRHYRKGRGDFSEWLSRELTKELEFQDFPTPEGIENLRACTRSSHSFHWVEFVRSRKNNVPLQGYGFRISFPGEIQGPIAIGALCHFGLGVFLPEKR